MLPPPAPPLKIGFPSLFERVVSRFRSKFIFHAVFSHLAFGVRQQEECGGRAVVGLWVRLWSGSAVLWLGDLVQISHLH